MVIEKLDPITFTTKLFFVVFVVFCFFLPNIHVHLSILYLLLNFQDFLDLFIF